LLLDFEVVGKFREKLIYRLGAELLSSIGAI
jgi:hypothetical protein